MNNMTKKSVRIGSTKLLPSPKIRSMHFMMYSWKRSSKLTSKSENWWQLKVQSLSLKEVLNDS